MAGYAQTDGYTAHTTVGVISASGQGSESTGSVTYGFRWGYSLPPTSEAEQGFSDSAVWGQFISVGADIITYGQAYFGIRSGSILSAKTKANAATASTPGSSAITHNSATINCDYTPNVFSSTCSAQLQYKKTTDVSWTNAGSPATTGGTSLTNVSRDITGLDASTQYQVRLVITRTTLNDTSLTSATHSFNTAAGVPSVTTNASSSVTSSTAQLNATVTINSGTGVEVYWKWGTDNPPTQNTTATQSVSGDGTFSIGISGLSSSTTYYTQAFTSFSTPSGSPTNGSVVQFNTAEDPLLDAAEEAHAYL